jgi:hypothetical protein
MRSYRGHEASQSLGRYGQSGKRARRSQADVQQRRDIGPDQRTGGGAVLDRHLDRRLRSRRARRVWTVPTTSRRAGHRARLVTTKSRARSAKRWPLRVRHAIDEMAQKIRARQIRVIKPMSLKTRLNFVTSYESRTWLSPIFARRGIHVSAFSRVMIRSKPHTGSSSTEAEHSIKRRIQWLI